MIDSAVLFSGAEVELVKGEDWVVPDKLDVTREELAALGLASSLSAERADPGGNVPSGEITLPRRPLAPANSIREARMVTYYGAGYGWAAFAVRLRALALSVGKPGKGIQVSSDKLELRRHTFVGEGADLL